MISSCQYVSAESIMQVDSSDGTRNELSRKRRIEKIEGHVAGRNFSSGTTEATTFRIQVLAKDVYDWQQDPQNSDRSEKALEWLEQLCLRVPTRKKTHDEDESWISELTLEDYLQANAEAQAWLAEAEAGPQSKGTEKVEVDEKSSTQKNPGEIEMEEIPKTTSF